MGADPRHPARLLQDERDPHVPAAQLRRRLRADVPDLRERVLLAPDEGLQRDRLPDREGAAAFRALARLDDPRPGRNRRSARRRLRAPRRRRRLVPLLADAVRVRGARARRLRSRRALCGSAGAAQDPRRDGAVRGDRRSRRRQPGRRLRARPRRRPERPPEAGVRLLGNRRRGARALQPVRGRARRVPDRRPPERRQHASGGDLPGRSRRRDPGDHPLLGARRRAAHPPPHPHRPPGQGRGLDRRRSRRREQLAAHRPDRVRRRLRHAAAVRRPRRAARGALGRAQPRRRGNDARRRRDGVLDGAAPAHDDGRRARGRDRESPRSPGR